MSETLVCDRIFTGPPFYALPDGGLAFQHEFEVRAVHYNST
ncbi:MAG: hypothetical protein P8126_01230 [Gammaproteobacteria bacterium]|jgi:hypothetical protein